MRPVASLRRLAGLVERGSLLPPRGQEVLVREVPRLAVPSRRRCLLGRYVRPRATPPLGGLVVDEDLVPPLPLVEQDEVVEKNARQDDRRDLVDVEVHAVLQDHEFP
ncbi:unnamed protein product, partial [Ectocarpus sp. 12 AP-2014]